MSRLVAGVDSSTQSCKVVVSDADTGQTLRSGSAPHPDGSEVDPAAWWRAFELAATRAGGLSDVAALGVAAQQHGLVTLDAEGGVVRDALLWNDTRSAAAAAQLLTELPKGAAQWAAATGSVPVASFTVTKLRWLAEHEPDLAGRVAAVCLPHDWLTWRLAGAGRLDRLTTDRSDASGTGYWSPADGRYRLDLLELALGRRAEVPTVLDSSAAAGRTSSGAIVAAGAGDNAAAALGLSAGPGDVVVSVGTSGTVFAVSRRPTADPSGAVAGFADATGRFLPLVCTLNAARVLTATARILGVSLARLSELALSAPAGAGGAVVVPYFEGERTPNRPDATASVHGLTLSTSTPQHLARAAFEGLLCGLADGLDALRAQSIAVRRVILIGGGARSEALQRLAPAVFGVPVEVPEPDEYVAVGAARQAAWALDGSADPPAWSTSELRRFEAEPEPHVREQYAAAQTSAVPPGRVTDVRQHNWGGNVTFGALDRHHPGSTDELQELVARTEHVKAIGAGHSFSPIADTEGSMISLDRLGGEIVVDTTASTVKVPAGASYAHVAAALAPRGWALPNLASITTISVAGGCSTGTHGSGVRLPSLSTHAVAVEFVRADGELVTMTEDDEAFPGAVLGLGVLGVITRLTLTVVPAFDVTQSIWLGLPLRSAVENFTDIMSSGYSVSMFCDWRPEMTVRGVWVKTLAGDDEADGSRWGANAARDPQHPIRGRDPAEATEQLGSVGPWNSRLPHFRAERISDVGHERQTEYFLALDRAPEALEALSRIDLQDALQVCEIRTVAADDLWLSPCRGRPSVALHFTWTAVDQAMWAGIAAVEGALAGLASRPHWAKVFATPPDEVRAHYPDLEKFRGLVAALDPGRKFRNPFTTRYLEI